MFIVTGGAGFIGSNLVAGLNRLDKRNILVVDNLEKGDKFKNLISLDFTDFQDKEEFRHSLSHGHFDSLKVDAIFHQGACSDTMEYNGRYMMDNNYNYSKELLHFAMEQKIPFIYASSAAVYGNSQEFTEDPNNENPLNVYGYSKLLFDRFVEQCLPAIPKKMPVMGLRYFNVYGPGENHKGRMASMVHQLYHQLKQTGIARLFAGSGGYANGEQRRDFISVDDVVKINLYLAGLGIDNEKASRWKAAKGVVNVGTGASRSFNDIANTLIHLLGKGEIQYTPMPEGLIQKYQNFTQANITLLHTAGYKAPFASLEEGIASFVKAIQEKE
ncbi:MAG: ADP-glyceromanno-heptose 6-epimerase [Magnetococcales bacterium]|nr:ADP-glyceromanno-heptose 6-epimerase [Magnetococcales bacterium]